MFEQEYKKMFREVKPSRELEAETLNLLLEMRDHPPAQPAPKQRLAPVFITLGASVAAVFLVTLISVGFVRSAKNNMISDFSEFGEELTDDNESLFEDSLESEDSDEKSDDDNSHSDQKQDDATKDDADKSDGAPAVDDTTDESTENDQSEPAEPNRGQEENNSESTESPDFLGEGYAGGTSDAFQRILIECSPKVNNTGGIRTYLSIKEFVDALEKKSTLGYGAKYYNARELVIVPTRLPEQTLFRHLYLDTKTGGYSYQYALSFKNKAYLLTVENKSPRAASLQALKEELSYLAGEEVTKTVTGTTCTYTFGAETVTVTAVPVVAEERLTDGECAELFSQLEFGRSTLDNELISMKFPTEEEIKNGAV